MKYVSVTFLHKTPMSQFSAMIHIHVPVPDDAEMYDTHAAIAQATKELWENMDNPEWWHFRGVTAPYPVDEVKEPH